MISDRCDFNDFVLKTKGREYQEIIYMTEREATEAERRFYHHSTPDSEKVNGGQGYARSLKGFIAFMRYGVKPAHINQETLMLFDHFRDDVRLNMRPARIKH